MNTPGHSVLTGRGFPQRPEASLHVRSPGDRSTGRGSDLRTRPSPVADAASVRQAALSCAAEPRCPRRTITAPSALPVDTGQILCLSTGAPHSPRHPAGDPECPPPHPCPQMSVQAYARLSFWKKLWWRGEPTGLGANPGSCTSYWRPAPAAYTLRASVSIREVGMMTGPASWSLLVSGAAKVPQTKWLKVIETCPLPVLEAGSLTSRCGQGDFP